MTGDLIGLPESLDAKLRKITTRRRAAGNVSFFRARSLKAIPIDSAAAAKSSLAAGQTEHREGNQ